MRNLLVACACGLAALPASADTTFVGASAAWDCAKEPSVHIMHGGGRYVFKGSCRTISIEGGDNQLTIEAVDLLQVVGAGNAVEVGTLDTAKIVGADNRLTWRRARSGDRPKVSVIGADNQIARAR